MALFRKLRTRLGFRKETYRFGFKLPNGVHVGEWTYGIEEKGLFGCDLSTPLQIGKFCSIAQNVSFLCKANHPTHFASTFPFKTEMTRVEPNGSDLIDNGSITIGNDVWIGRGVTIMPNVTIGHGAVIGTNALVNKDIPPYAIVVGVPAKILKFRFTKPQIEKLLNIQWWNWSDQKIIDEQPSFFIPIDQFIDLHQ
ncbi:CatB-related O-acetyltransferase [Pseudochrobactrum sp. sp1633]|uniref:CatB-related O-acetyltransferase n=1 Tax=Pseudochrobactrum sp. sp1633 TaxID=3036706 RepID=UPI0025A4D088|nr:CatB-related O-acetyltransferase [Pseudochrobactrum sp. sp1633]MDM8346467.1 CatB-related O-acetyltransferase [Pseudochrobactrum sp. sp1633]